ncbi:hypothetical protein [Nakamurella endophytica]|uniref:SHOCT domain-containing protein n=1 Tax=Nakamurella endophytica TaxID=1748367 RepID=A0A917SZ87_9ACTN|nr:hypothetical protein [Nakamurella endophytica]GGM04648.1 hypothetical protein GCM10011594_26120 [Nakamurella endophytica]
MGLIRKAASLSTLGAVNYRSKDDRKVKVMEANSKAEIKAEKERLAIERQRASAAAVEAQAYAAAQAAADEGNSVAGRLRQLDALMQQGLITADDHAARKVQILAEI